MITKQLEMGIEKMKFRLPKFSLWTKLKKAFTLWCSS